MSAKKNIAFFCHPYHRGGVTRWMADAAIAYTKDGYTVYFVTVAPRQPFFSGIGRETMLQLLAKDGADIHIIKSAVGREFEFGTPEYRAFVYKKLLAQLPLGTPVILSDDDVVWKAATYMHASFPLIGVLHADEEYYYSLGAKYYKQVDVLACVSNRVNRNITARLQQQVTDNIYTIPCGINLPPVNTNTTQNSQLQLVYVGRVSDYQKRTSDLVKIAALLSKNKVDFHLNIIGDGDAKITLEQKFNSDGLAGYVTFRGWLSQGEVAEYLCRSDILVLTSDFEGTPIAMMEALASGCAIAGTRVSGIEDYEHHAAAPNCFMAFNVGDIEDAVSKIIKLSAIPLSARQRSARAIAEDSFSMQTCLQKYSAAIDKVPARTYTKVNISLSPAAMLRSRLISFARFLKVNAAKKPSR